MMTEAEKNTNKRFTVDELNGIYLYRQHTQTRKLGNHGSIWRTLHLRGHRATA
jgi:hypothetical protein